MNLTIYHGCPSLPRLEILKSEYPELDQRAMWTHRVLTVSDYRYALDNGAFAAYKNDEQWAEEYRHKFVKRLDQIKEGRMGRKPDFVVLPDVVGDAERTYRRARKWAEVMDKYGFSHYFPLQDGMDLREAITEASFLGSSGVFIGGTDEFKLKTPEIVRLVQETEPGLNIHLARPNVSEAPLVWAEENGVDSIDTTNIVVNLTGKNTHGWKHMEEAAKQETLGDWNED